MFITLLQLKLIAKTNAARELEKQQLSSEPVKRSDPHRRSINAAELNFALSTGSLKKNIRASQVELASTPSVTTSSEALAIAGSTGHLSAVGSVGHLPAAGSAGHLVSAASAGHLAVHTPRKSSQSQRSSGLSDSQPTPNRGNQSIVYGHVWFDSSCKNLIFVNYWLMSCCAMLVTQ